MTYFTRGVTGDADTSRGVLSFAGSVIQTESFLGMTKVKMLFLMWLP